MEFNLGVMYIYFKKTLRYLFETVKRPSCWRVNWSLFRVSVMRRHTEGTVSIAGRKFYFPDSASFLFMYQEIFDKQIYSFSSSAKAPYIIDAGANIGLATVFFKHLYPKARILAFEPDTKITSFLKKNIQSLKLKDVEVIEKGLWDTEGTLSFLSDGSDGGRMADTGAQESIKVPVTRLRNFLTQKVDLLKIDIEGSEGRVLEDSKDLLENVQNLFVEYHSFSDQPQELSRILAIISKAGFRFYIESVGVTSKKPFIEQPDRLGIDLQLNIFAFKP